MGENEEEELAQGKQRSCPAVCSRAMSGAGQGSCLVAPWESEKGILIQWVPGPASARTQAGQWTGLRSLKGREARGRRENQSPPSPRWPPPVPPSPQRGLQLQAV